MTAASVFAVVMIGLQGLAAIELLVGMRRLGLARACAAALPIGLVAHATLALPLYLAGLAVSQGSAVLQLVLLGVAAWVAARRRPAPIPPARESREPREPREPRTHPWRAGERLAAGLIVLVLVAIAVTAALEPPVEWDLLAIWGLKAKALGVSGRGLELLRAPAFAYAHPDYPLAWPLALALEPAFTARAPVGGGGFLGAAMLAATAGFAAVMLRRWGRRAALAGAGLLALMPLAGAQAVRGQADLPLAALFLVAAGLLCAWTEERDDAALAVGVVATAGLAIVKQEGMALAAALAALSLIRAPAGRRLRLTGALGAAFLAVVLPWLFLRSTLPAGAANSFTDMTPVRALTGLTRLPELLAALPLYLGAPADWGAFWLLVGLALAGLAAGRRRLLQETWLAVVLLGPVPLYLLALSATAWEPARIAEVTLSRLALHFAPLATVIAVAVAARYGTFGREPGSLAAAAGRELHE